jgi:hypothetical protein
VRAREAISVAELAADYERRLENAAAASGDAVALARGRLLEEVLTCRCPACGAAFADFDGCFLVSCGRCGKAFCGWCLQLPAAGGADPHAHVAACSGRGSVYGTLAEFEERQRVRAAEGLAGLLAGLPGDAERRRLLRESRAELEGVGLRGEEFEALLGSEEGEEKGRADE